MLDRTVRGFKESTPRIESPLNNSLLVQSASHHRVGGNIAVEQSRENEDTKKPQLPQDHSEVVASAATAPRHRIAECALTSCDQVFRPSHVTMAARLHCAA